MRLNNLQITETFTPPPPSNWGLPGDRSYQYVSFPSLQSDLFGKIRTPKQWEQVSRQRRGVSSATLGQQQQILSKVLMPASQSTLANHTKDVDWAIHLLARHVGEDGTVEEGEVGDERTSQDKRRAKNLILASNRKQSNLLQLVIKIQSLYRMRAACRAAHTLRQEKLVSTEIREAVKKTKSTFLVSAVICQRLYRGYKARKLAGTRSTAAKRIQQWGRGILIREAYLQLVAGAIIVQAIARGRRVRFVYKLTLDTLASIQAQARGWLTRRNVSRLRRTRVYYYRLQMFELWRHARVPLAYRSSFWSLIDGSGFLHFSIIEKELSRCWDFLNVDFSVLSDGQSPSTPTTRYDRYVLVEERLEAVRPKKDRVQERFAKLIPCFPSEDPRGLQNPQDVKKSQMLHQASEQLTLERLRIYERLCTIKKEASLSAMYSALSIPIDAKLKKRTFAEQIWTCSEKADQSAALIFSLFPESKGGNCIRSSSAPTKKAKKRFSKLTTYQQPPLDGKLFVSAKRDELVKSDLRDITVALFCGVQTLWAKMDTAGSTSKMSSSLHFSRQREAIAAGLCWEDKRWSLIRCFLYGKTTE